MFKLNIKSKYLINYKDDRYLISSKNKDITFSSFIGRISDTKYIVAGKNLKLKLTSYENTKVVSSTGNLVENYRDIKFQELSNKKVFLENESRVSFKTERRNKYYVYTIK